MSKSDPIFAAIENYRATYERFSAAIKAVDAYQNRHRKGDRRRRGLERRQRGLGDVNVRAIRKFSRTKPQTLTGVVAALRFAEERRSAGDEFLHCYSGGNDTSYPVFLSTLRKALERLPA